MGVVTIDMDQSKQHDKGQSWEGDPGVRCNRTTVWLGLPSLDNSLFVFNCLPSSSPCLHTAAVRESAHRGPAEHNALHKALLRYLPFFFSLTDARPLLYNVMALSGLFVYMANSDILEGEAFAFTYPVVSTPSPMLGAFWTVSECLITVRMLLNIK